MVGEIEAVLEALNRANVRYRVVGGVAVVLHGYLRTTADLDLVVHLERENVLRAVGTLDQLGYRPRAPVDAASLAEPEAREHWVQAKHLVVFSMWNPNRPGLEIDLFVEEPFNFEEVYGRSLRVPLRHTWATVVALADLLELKRAAARPIDLQDVSALESILAESPGERDEKDSRGPHEL